MKRRIAAGLPVGRPDSRFLRAILSHPDCGGACSEVFTEILDQVLTEAALDGGEPVPRDRPEPSAIAEVLTAVGAPMAERRAAIRGIDLAAAWVRSAPDPAARLRTLIARPPDDRWSMARVAWNGAGMPLVSALVFNEELPAWLPPADSTPIHFFPEPNPLPYEPAPWGPRSTRQRLTTLDSLAHGDRPSIVITSARVNDQSGEELRIIASIHN